VTEAHDPHLPPLVVNCEEDQVAADHELAHFVGNKTVLLGLWFPTGHETEGVDSVPHPLQPTLRTLRRLTFDRDAASLVADL